MQQRDGTQWPGPLRDNIKVGHAAPGAVFDARLATPFAVLGIRTAGERLAGIEYLPQGAATLAPPLPSSASAPPLPTATASAAPIPTPRPTAPRPKHTATAATPPVDMQIH